MSSLQTQLQKIEAGVFSTTHHCFGDSTEAAARELANWWRGFEEGEKVRDVEKSSPVPEMM